jgi:hypothetical protein
MRFEGVKQFDVIRFRHFVAVLVTVECARLLYVRRVCVYKHVFAVVVANHVHSWTMLDLRIPEPIGDGVNYAGQFPPDFWIVRASVAVEGFRVPPSSFVVLPRSEGHPATNGK